MLKAERLQKILAQINRDNRVVLENLSASLEVSTDTIRRDIKELSDKGLLKAVRGGAITVPVIHETFMERKSVDAPLKQLIAQKVLEFIKPNQVILIDAGSTNAVLAEVLPKNLNLTVITNSFPVVSILEHFPEISLIFIGGRVNTKSLSTNGIETIQALRNFRPDLCLLGVCSIDLKLGITGCEYEESLIKKTMVEISKYVIALSTYDKVAKTDPYYICAANAIDVFITERDPSSSELADFKESGILIK